MVFLLLNTFSCFISHKFDFILCNHDEHIEPTSFITCMPHLEYAVQKKQPKHQLVFDSLAYQTLVRNPCKFCIHI